MDEVVKRDDVGVFQVLQQRHWKKHKVSESRLDGLGTETPQRAGGECRGEETAGRGLSLGPWACTFSDGGAGGSLVMLEPDLLQGHQVLGEFAPPFEDRGVRPLETQTGDVL